MSATFSRLPSTLKAQDKQRMSSLSPTIKTSKTISGIKTVRSIAPYKLPATTTTTSSTIKMSKTSTAAKDPSHSRRRIKSLACARGIVTSGAALQKTTKMIKTTATGKSTQSYLSGLSRVEASMIMSPSVVRGWPEGEGPMGGRSPETIIELEPRYEDRLVEEDLHAAWIMWTLSQGFRIILIAFAVVELYFGIMTTVYLLNHRKQLITARYHEDEHLYNVAIRLGYAHTVSVLFLISELTLLDELWTLMLGFLIKVAVMTFTCFDAQANPDVEVEYESLILNGLINAFTLCYLLLKGFNIYDVDEDGRKPERPKREEEAETISQLRAAAAAAATGSQSRLALGESRQQQHHNDQQMNVGEWRR